MGVTIKRIGSSKLRTIAKGMTPKASAVVRKTAFQVEADWKAGVRVDTGALKNSIQTVIDGPLSARVVSGVAHATFNEFGTVNMPANPAATRAAERGRATFLAGMKGIASG